MIYSFLINNITIPQDIYITWIAFLYYSFLAFLLINFPFYYCCLENPVEVYLGNEGSARSRCQSLKRPKTNGDDENFRQIHEWTRNSNLGRSDSARNVPGLRRWEFSELWNIWIPKFMTGQENLMGKVTDKIGNNKICWAIKAEYLGKKRAEIAFFIVHNMP